MGDGLLTSMACLWEIVEFAMAKLSRQERVSMLEIANGGYFGWPSEHIVDFHNAQVEHSIGSVGFI